MKASKASDVVPEMKPPRIRANKQKIKTPGFVSVNIRFLNLFLAIKWNIKPIPSNQAVATHKVYTSRHYIAASCPNFHNMLLHTYISWRSVSDDKTHSRTESLKPAVQWARFLHDQFTNGLCTHFYRHANSVTLPCTLLSHWQRWSSEYKQMRHCCVF